MGSLHRRGRARIAFGAAVHSLALAVVALTTALFGSFARADFYEIEPLLLNGDPAPGGGTVHVARMRDFNGRELVFVARDVGGTNAGIFLESDGVTVPIARDGDPVPGAEGETFDFLAGFSDAALSPGGDLAFISFAGIFLAPEAQPSPVNLDVLPSQSLSREAGLAVDDAGQVAWFGQTDAAAPFGVHLESNGATLPLALAGDAAPGGGVFSFIFRGDVLVGIDTTGGVVFNATAAAARPDRIYRAAPGSAELVVAADAAAPGSAGGSFRRVQGCAANARGDVIYAGDIVGGEVTSGLFVNRDGVDESLVLSGDPVSGEDDLAIYALQTEGIGLCSTNDRGEVAFAAFVSEERRGLFVASHGELIPVLLNGAVGPPVQLGCRFRIDDSGDIVFDAHGARTDGMYLATRVTEVGIHVASGGATGDLHASESGIVSVALLGSERLDAAEVDVGTLAFGAGAAAPIHAAGGHLRDTNGDGHTDLVSHYRVGDASIGVGSSEACLHGETLEGRRFQGCARVTRRRQGASRRYDTSDRDRSRPPTCHTDPIQRSVSSRLIVALASARMRRTISPAGRISSIPPTP
jgi:hypothetical protein